MTLELDPAPAFVPVAFDFYRDIHKAIRAELFDVTLAAGRVDPSDGPAGVELAARVGRIADLLVVHAEHEDDAIQPALESHLPALAERIAGDHVRIDARLVSLLDWAADSAAATGDRRFTTHHLYIELASFTSTYLEHQDAEERLVMPALEDAIGVEAVVAIHQQLVGHMAPADLFAALTIMIPAINVDDRTELLGGIHANAPTESFDLVWALTQQLLRPAELSTLGARLQVS